MTSNGAFELSKKSLTLLASLAVLRLLVYLQQITNLESEGQLTRDTVGEDPFRQKMGVAAMASDQKD